MSDPIPASPDSTPAAVPSFKPALAPGVKSQVMLPNAAQPTGPGLAAGPATFSPVVKPPLGAPKPRLRAIEPQPSPSISSYKVSSPAPTQYEATVPVAHLVGSGLAAGIAITAAVLLFLKS
ncbi:MAG TPA: hypothetical protein VIK52_07290 [Opitutaceae bacterium]